MCIILIKTYVLNGDENLATSYKLIERGYVFFSDGNKKH